MRFDVITLFPELFDPFLKSGINRRAFESGQVDVRLWNPRDFAEGNYRRVDDRPFGGGPGMVMMAEPLWRCLQAIRTDRAEADEARVPVVLFSPIGQRLDHAMAVGWSQSNGAVLVETDGTRRVIGVGDGLPGDSVYAFTQSGDGRVWIEPTPA